jgi:hypothetical protein
VLTDHIYKSPPDSERPQLLLTHSAVPLSARSYQSSDSGLARSHRGESLRSPRQILLGTVQTKLSPANRILCIGELNASALPLKRETRLEQWSLRSCSRHTTTTRTELVPGYRLDRLSVSLLQPSTSLRRAYEPARLSLLSSVLLRLRIEHLSDSPFPESTISLIESAESAEWSSGELTLN